MGKNAGTPQDDLNGGSCHSGEHPNDRHRGDETPRGTQELLASEGGALKQLISPGAEAYL